MLSTYTLGCKNVIFTGDFNANILEDTSLVEDMNSNGLNLVNKANPIHFTFISSILLDLCFTNNIFRLPLFDQLSAPMLSRHDLLFTSYNFDLLRSAQRITFQYRDCKNIDYQSLGTELLSLD